MSEINESELRLIREVGKYTIDPLNFVRFAFPWGAKGELEENKGPRKWQESVLDEIGKRLQNEKTRYQPIKIAIASGHGSGKSALVAQIIAWALSTCDSTRVVITANTESQLRTKTFPEVTKWQKLMINKHWFVPTATAIYAKAPSFQKTWRADAVTWSENNTEAFAGLHNKGKRIVVIMDEASSISDKVWEVTEGAMTDEGTEIIWLVCGNPTRNIGRFKDCFTSQKGSWITRQIDTREVEGVNQTQVNEWIKLYGENSDFVKVRVRGIFPSASFKQFISTDDVDAAFGRQIKEHQYSFAPKIITVDPSWEGDDETVIGLRQGLVFSILKTFPKNDNDVHIANLVASLEDEHKADAVFIDGGYGTGIVSVGRTLGRNWQIVWFAEKPMNEGYLNKRAEMWGEVKRWLKEGGCIPKDNILYSELIAPETVARLDGKIQLESKKDMKARGAMSPNRADALAISFAYHVKAKEQTLVSQSNSKRNYSSEYDPYRD